VSDHADELEHADPADLEHVDVDPANGTEPYDPASDLPADSQQDAGTSPAFTAPEKITSVVRAVLARPGEPRVRTLLAVITSPLGDRLLLRPMLALLPPLDAADEWDAWLALLAGCALELVSDGVEIDLAEVQAEARFLLAALFASEADDVERGYG